LLPLKEDPDKMICSEHSTLFDRAEGLRPFADDWPAYRVHPAHYMTSHVFEKLDVPKP